MKSLTRRWFGAFATVITLLIVTQTATAGVIAYDGFAAGGGPPDVGRSPGGTSYTTSPASANGLNNDSLSTQSPISTGFADSAAWAFSGGAVAAGIYWEAQSGGLSYANYEPNTSGQARIFSTLGNFSSARLTTRTATTTDTSDIQWVAMLLDFSSTPATTLTEDFIVTLEYGEPGDSTAPYDGAWTPATFGVTSDGKAFYRTATGTSRVDVEAASALSAGTHLFLLKFDDRPGTTGTDRYDDVTLWVDPVLTADPNDLGGGLSAASIMRSDLGGGMHSFDEISFSAYLTNNNPVVFDEFIITNDYNDIFAVAVPESSSALLALSGILGVALLPILRRKNRG